MKWFCVIMIITLVSADNYDDCISAVRCLRNRGRQNCGNGQFSLFVNYSCLECASTWLNCRSTFLQGGCLLVEDWPSHDVSYETFLVVDEAMETSRFLLADDVDRSARLLRTHRALLLLYTLSATHQVFHQSSAILFRCTLHVLRKNHVECLGVACCHIPTVCGLEIGSVLHSALCSPLTRCCRHFATHYGQQLAVVATWQTP